MSFSSCPKLGKDSIGSNTHIDHAIYPVTALAFASADTTILLLAGEGPSLRIYESQSCRLLWNQKLLTSQYIHGIKARTRPATERNANALIQVLVWAGCWIFTLEIDSCEFISDKGTLTVTRISEARVHDRILHACFLQNVGDRHVPGNATALLLTSHNVLFSLCIDETNGTILRNSKLCYESAGPRSLLYSAHVILLPTGRGLVAAGTVFGQVLVWSFAASRVQEGGLSRIPMQLHCVFNGHEGSVFGVRISEHDASVLAKRFVASCSDDRTIRVWDVTDLSKEVVDTGELGKSDSIDDSLAEEYRERAARSCVATVMGHTSRIWDIRFLSMQQDSCNLVSYGEDATAQIWQISPSLENLVIEDVAMPLRLHHCSTYGFHSGKNIWAIATSQDRGSGCRIATGGADGRIAYYHLDECENHSVAKSWRRQYDMEEVRSQLIRRNVTEQLFDSLKGKWKLVRHLQSALPSFPSGTLEGTATFHERESTESSYEKEYLYIENGQFTTAQGINMSASRRYVYRFQKSMERISAWFVKPEDGETVDYLFHELNINGSMDQLPDSSENDTQGSMIASGHHLCIDDEYQADYSFGKMDSRIQIWGLKYTVQGPKKNYVSDATYFREEADKASGTSLDASPSSKMIVDNSTFSKLTTGTPSSLECGPAITDSFKTYTWINENSFLATTGDGWVLVGRIEDQQSSQEPFPISWDRLGQYSNLKGTCLTARFEQTNMMVLTGKEGTLYLYQQDWKDLQSLMKLPRKVAYLQASGCNSNMDSTGHVFASCLGSSTAYCLLLSVEPTSLSCERFELELPTAFVTTSACFIIRQGMMVLGSRSGDILIYDIEAKSQSLSFLQRLHINNVHGKETVTSIQALPNSEISFNTHTIYILTTGRNATYSIHAITHHPSQPFTFQTVHAGTPSFGPNIEGAYFCPTNHTFSLYGFRSRDFVVWNETLQQESLSIDCGGAHRNWAFTPLCDKDSSGGGGRFVWTKASTLNLHSQAEASHQIIQPGGHGREIKAVAVSPKVHRHDGEEMRLVATGAEDTSIRIFGYAGRGQGGYRCLHTLSRHVTGVQQLRWSSNGQVLFSAAGREEFFVWQVQPVPYVEIGVVCISECAAVTEEGDLRIMDFDVLELKNGNGEIERRFLLTMVYSDSSVRVSCPRSLAEYN